MSYNKGRDGFNGISLGSLDVYPFPVLLLIISLLKFMQRYGRVRCCDHVFRRRYGDEDICFPHCYRCPYSRLNENKVHPENEFIVENTK